MKDAIPHLSYPSAERAPGQGLHGQRASAEGAPSISTADGCKRIADNALVALTIMVAASDPVEKGYFVGMTINLINRKN